jgi:putative spermidine/putrescine transport system permease protein
LDPFNNTSEVAPIRLKGKHRAWIDRSGAALLALLAGIGLLSLILPTLIVVIESFDTRRFIAFPPAGFSLDRYRAVFASDTIVSSAELSFVCALVVITLDVLLGVPAAIALVRGAFRGKAMLTAFLLSPIMLPGIVIGIAILIFFSLLGFSPSLPLMVLSHVVFTLPFLMRLTMARMERTNVTLDEAAANLGASRWQVFRHVLLPQLWPGLIAGAGFSFLNSFDNLTISLFTAPIRQRPLPIELFYMTRFDLDPRVAAIAALEFVFALVLVALASGRLRKGGLMRDL